MLICQITGRIRIATLQKDLAIHYKKEHPRHPKLITIQNSKFIIIAILLMHAYLCHEKFVFYLPTYYLFCN